MSQALQALAEAVYVAMTSPPLSYTTQNANGTYGSATLPAANVVKKAVWLSGPNPPDPLVAFAVSGRGVKSRYLSDRDLRVKLWTVSNFPLAATFLYEAVRARLHLADQEGAEYASTGDISRAAAANALGVSVRECVEIEALPEEFDVQTGRWYCYAVFKVTAT